MGQHDQSSPASEGAEGGVATEEAAQGFFGGNVRVQKARTNGDDSDLSTRPSKKSVRRIAPHTRPHLDEYVAAVLAREAFALQAERIWPGISTAEFLPLDGTREDHLSTQNDPTVLKLGCGGHPGIERDDVVDEHALPDEERRDQCTTTLMAERLNLPPEDMFLLVPLLKEVREGDKRGRQPLGALHLSNLAMKPLRPAETYVDRLEKISWGVHIAMDDQRHYLEAAEKLKPSDIWHFPWQNSQVEAHVLNYTDPWESVQFGDAVTAVCHTRGAKMITIRNPDGHIQIIGDAQKKLPMQDVALAVRAYECHLRQRSLPPLADLRRRGTIPEVPEWHFSDSGNLLNGGQAQPWTPATLIQLDALKSAIGHALDAAWMKANKFTA